MNAGRRIPEFSPDDIAALARKEYEAKKSTSTGYAAAQPVGQSASSSPGISREELLAGIAKEADAEKAIKKPMDPAEYRRRQEAGLRPEMASSMPSEARQTPLSYDELLKQYYPHHLDQEADVQVANVGSAPQVSPTEDELQRLEVLQAMERSQMPAVADGAGFLVKTIEHYAFSDAEDSASFSINFDKDLWEGASSFVQVSQVRIDSSATSLEIRLQGIPVADRMDVLADWRLVLSPLFARVEPSMTTHKVRGNKLTVKLAKSKQGAWKKGVK